MVDYSSDDLDRAFAALADPTRRAIVARLAGAPGLSISEIASPFDVSLPAVIKHLDTLERARLIARAKTGRVVRCRLQHEPMEAAMTWLRKYEQFWSERLDRLVAFVEESPCSPGQVSPSSAGSKLSPRKSGPRGRTRKR